MLPRCEMFKEILFVPRIICFNESFVPLGKLTANKRAIAIIWHEATAGRSQCDIISTFHKFLSMHRDANEITIWMDNCAAQNKNWTLYCFFVHHINSDNTTISSIKLKYLQTGHTFMSADSFHHQIEKSLKQKGKVLDFDDYKSCVQNANSGKTTCVEMNVYDFLDVKDCSSRFKLSKTVPKPLLSNFSEVNFIRGSNNLFYKTAFGGDPVELCFLTATALKKGVLEPEVRSAPRGVTAVRKKNIIQKLQGMSIPKNRLKFWEELHETDNETELN